MSMIANLALRHDPRPVLVPIDIPALKNGDIVVYLIAEDGIYRLVLVRQASC